MNIISNDCTAGFIYRELNQKYGNPFIWTSINLDNFIKLIENYDTINFSNMTDIKLIENNSKISVQHEMCPVIMIDNLIDVYYFHHFYKEGVSEEQNTTKRYIYDENISEYVLESYKRRLNNMTENPIFILSDSDCYKWYKSDLKRFNNIKTSHKIIIYTHKEVSFDNPNILVVKKEHNDVLIEKNAISLSSTLKK